MQNRSSAAFDLSVSAGIVLMTAAAWEAGVRAFAVPVYLLPPPSLILLTLWKHAPQYGLDSLLTLFEAVSGLALGTAAGLTSALLLSFFPRLEKGVMTLAILLKSTPMVAVAPLLTIWLGFGILPKIIITALLAFFPVLVNVLSGLQSVDAAMLETLHSWHASRSEIFRYLRLPHALPYLFAALKVSAPLALVGAVVAEWTGASGGLGYTMWLAYTNLNLPFLFAAVLILGLAGILIYTLLNRCEEIVVFWEKKG